MAPRLAVAAFLVAAASFAQPTPQQPLTIGSANTATADPTVPRVRGTPCRVQLYTNVQFNDFSAKPFTYAPPAHCPGPWKQVVLEADFSIEAGRQFDRTANLWMNGVNIYFGTTAEPSHDVARAWHVERDLTEYSSILYAPTTGNVDLGNLVDSTYTSSLWGSADLAFYSDRDAPRVADQVLSLSNGGTVALNDPTQQLSATFTLPRNIENAYLDVVLQHQGANDEFWYTCVPNDLTGELFSCAGTGFREGEVNIDGQPAGVVPIYPWIFTGGIDPLLWRPIPGVQTLNFIPYRVDLTPFAGVLSNGQPHTIGISVFNDSVYFSTTASLVLYLDRGSRSVTGAVTANNIGAPSPTVKTNLATDSEGTTTGTVAVTSSRRFTVAGWVKTSHGKVSTEVSQKIDFSNSQQFQSPATAPIDFIQNITQGTQIESLTTTRGGLRDGERFTQQSWPLTVDLTFHPDGTFQTSIQQSYERYDLGTFFGFPISGGFVSNKVAPTDLYPSGQGQANSQDYFSIGANGCYSRKITAAGGVLTSIADGKECRF